MGLPLKRQPAERVKTQFKTVNTPVVVDDPTSGNYFTFKLPSYLFTPQKQTRRSSTGRNSLAKSKHEVGQRKTKSNSSLNRKAILFSSKTKN